MNTIKLWFVHFEYCGVYSNLVHWVQHQPKRDYLHPIGLMVMYILLFLFFVHNWRCVLSAARLFKLYERIILFSIRFIKFNFHELSSRFKWNVRITNILSVYYSGHVIVCANAIGKCKHVKANVCAWKLVVHSSPKTTNDIMRWQMDKNHMPFNLFHDDNLRALGIDTMWTIIYLKCWVLVSVIAESIR